VAEIVDLKVIDIAHAVDAVSVPLSENLFGGEVSVRLLGAPDQADILLNPLPERFVVPRGRNVTCGLHPFVEVAVAEDGSVGIRIPMMEFCTAMCRKLARPVVSTSANISGEPSPKVFADIPQEIVSAVDYVVPRYLEKGSTRLASQIIKVGLRDEVEVIRP
jgi:tRNA A37 threonylcarbamoyladenosine synthetase subunit TsaC/SUA5/YrdC